MESPSQQASEEKYRSLVESIDEGFCIIKMVFDAAGNPVDYIFLEINPAFERQTGLANVCGRSMRGLAPSHERHWFEIYGAVATTGEPIRFEHQAEQLSRWYDVYAWRHGDPADRQVAVLFKDITQRKHMEQELHRHQAELEATVARRTLEALRSQRQAAAAQRMACVGTLAAGLAHDMSNLLLPLGGQLGVLLKREHLDPEVRSELAVIGKLFDHLRDLSRNLMLFSRDPDKDGVSERTSIRSWYESVHKLLNASVGRKITIEWRLGADVPDVAIASHRLTQVVQNLVHNGRDAVLAAAANCPAHSPRIVVTVAASEDRSQVRIDVSDNGIGMDEATTERAAEPFFTTRDRPDGDGAMGTGLGLSLVHQIVERAAGSVAITSALGVGTTVTVVLPAAG